MKKATFFFRDGGLIITAVDDNHTAINIGQRMCAGGFIVGHDSFWGRNREVSINLKDVRAVILEEIAQS